MAPNGDKAPLAQKRRSAAITIAVTMVVWTGAQWLGPQVGLAGNYALLIDFFAMAAFVWALVVLIKVMRQENDR